MTRPCSLLTPHSSLPIASPTDIHIHVQPLEMMRPECLDVMRAKHRDFDAIAALARDPGAFVRLLDSEGIGRAGIINYVAEQVMGFTHDVNAWAARFAASHRDRLIPFGSVNPLTTADAAAEMDRIVGEYRLAAIKIHPPHQLFRANAYRDGLDALATVYARAQEARLPVMIHTGTSIFPGARNVFADPMAVDDVAVDFPRLRIILAHGGRPLYMDTAVFLVRRHSNVYMDISGIPPQSLMEYFPRLEGLSDKVLWGSDWPGPGVPGMRTNLERFLDLPLSQAAKERILHQNAAVLFPW